MRITGVESTDLFTGSGGTSGRALQVVRVTVEATEGGEAGAATTLRVMGAGADTPHPFVLTLPEPGESRACEVSVAVTGSPGTRLPVTVIAEPALADGGPAALARGRARRGGGRAGRTRRERCRRRAGLDDVDGVPLSLRPGVVEHAGAVHRGAAGAAGRGRRPARHQDRLRPGAA